MIKKYKHWVDQNRYPGPLEYELGSTQVYLHRDDLRCDNDASKIQQFEFEPWYSTNEATAPNLANELKVLSEQMLESQSVKRHLILILVLINLD